MADGSSLAALARIDTSPHVYLTFDDGPDPLWTPRVLDVLGARQLTATFFTIGQAVRAHRAIVRRIAAEGHALGNHTWSHRHPWWQSARRARQEVRDGAAAIADVTGRVPRTFRPPHGTLRRCMVEEAGRGGQRVVLWSVSAIDWGPFGSARRIAARLACTRAGDIVLMHDGRPQINRPSTLLDVLPAFLDALAYRKLPAAPLLEV
jgi:peptidoglycan-N-acetylglucosamine deacetylase